VEPHPVIVTAPGEDSQIDYGDGPIAAGAAKQVPDTTAVRGVPIVASRFACEVAHLC
jgi:hypothetical protein